MKQQSLKNTLQKSFQSGYSKGYLVGHKDALQVTVEMYSAVVLICLRDKFDFTTEQLQKMVIEINHQFDSVDQGYISLEDIVNTIEEEVGLHVTFNGITIMKMEVPSDEQQI